MDWQRLLPERRSETTRPPKALPTRLALGAILVTYAPAVALG